MITLTKGTTLIEASAGTGKTYTLCRIALQLTLERGITLDRILAVTFTEAATEELAARIHQLYQTCLLELETEQVTEPLLAELLEAGNLDVERAKHALRYSLEVFDEAPISTIHGFCKRALDLVALETRTPLDAELSHIENELIEQLQNEYTRQRALESSSCLAAAFPSQKDFSARLREIGRQSAIHPNARLRPKPAPIDLDSLDRRFSVLPGELADMLDGEDDYASALKGNTRIYKALGDPGSDFARAARRSALIPSDFAWLNEFTEEKWRKALKKGHEGLPTPKAISSITTLIDSVARAFQEIAFQYRAWLRERLADAKERANVISFNDLLHLLQRALAHDKDDRVATALSSRYDAALIDEFQDTDRIQFDIAHRLFGRGEHFLFFIGDPKQSIYRFRGADIYAYFQATKEGPYRKIDLDRNFRSTPSLVAAVNQLFSSARSGFADGRIEFHPVAAAKEDLAPPFRVGQPFRIQQLTLPNGSKPYGKGEYRRLLAERAANDFAARLNGDPGLDAASVTFLVNDRHEANELSNALLKRGIACAIRADRSVFQTTEASDWLQLLSALASPARASLKRGAFSCINRSITASAIASPDLESDLAAFMDFIVDWARNWQSWNVNVAFDQLIRLCPTGALAGPDMDLERRHSNFAQIAELLSEARDAENLSPRGLLNWLRRKADADVSQRDDWQTRVSSDEGKPQIITVHKSKGLQFPIVILPFVGLRRIRLDSRSAVYHDTEGELVIDFEPDDSSNAVDLSRSEELAEDIRLLYVALTRAEFENVVYLCPEEINLHANMLSSSFAQFLLGEGPRSSSELATALQALQAEHPSLFAFDQLACREDPIVRLERGAESRSATYSARSLAGRHRMPGPERVLSFSALSRSLHADLAASLSIAEAEEPAGDESTGRTTIIDTAAYVAESEVAFSIFTLPKGTRAGDLLHLILERYDFSRPETLAATTQQAFDSLRFEPRDYEPIVAAQIKAIAETPLENPFETFTLASTLPNQRVAELEFAYPVSGDTKIAIASAFASAPLGRVPQEWAKRFAAASAGLDASMLRGFIDLTVERNGRMYIFDWKSNYLGPTPDFYDDAAMQRAMGEHDYYLQYLLYCVALKRYLAWRYPNESFADRFGGVYYLFARGISPGKRTGIYYDHPAIELLEALDRALLSR